MRLESKATAIFRKTGELMRAYKNYDKVRDTLATQSTNERIMDFRRAKNAVIDSVAELVDMIDSVGGYGSSLDELMNIGSKVQIDKIELSK